MTSSKRLETLSKQSSTVILAMTKHYGRRHHRTQGNFQSFTLGTVGTVACFDNTQRIHNLTPLDQSTRISNYFFIAPARADCFPVSLSAAGNSTPSIEYLRVSRSEDWKFPCTKLGANHELGVPDTFEFTSSRLFNSPQRWQIQKSEYCFPAELCSQISQRTWRQSSQTILPTGARAKTLFRCVAGAEVGAMRARFFCSLTGSFTAGR